MIAAAGRSLTSDESMRLEDFVHRRLDGEPVARILGNKEFWGLPLKLSAATLVPRPDTETVVELALEMLRTAPDASRALRIADIGTGSGAILLALLSELPDAFGVGTDISEAALRTARANATSLGFASRAGFVACDYAAALFAPFDLIVSNPPYIRTADITALDGKSAITIRVARSTAAPMGLTPIARSSRKPCNFLRKEVHSWSKQDRARPAKLKV